VPDGFTANAVRYPVSALFWMPWLLFGLRSGQVRRLCVVALVPAAFNTIGQVFWSISPYYLDASLAAFLFQLSSVWSIIVAFVVFPDERRLAHSPRFWLGVTLAIGGFVLLSLPSLLNHQGGTPLGILFIFLCGVAMAFYGVSVRYVLRDMHPLTLFSLVATYTAVALLILAPLGEPGSLLRLQVGPAIWLIVSALIGIAFAHGLFYVSVQRLGVAVSYIALMTTPLLTLVGSFLVLGERFSVLQWAGGALLLAGSTAAVHAQVGLRARARTEPAGHTSKAESGGIDMPEPG
jgi:drug/metabolite transporter (DMT)-like permease